MPLKSISIRFRLMVLMIALTTLPVITVTWQATNNTRSSVETEMIGANKSRMMWASQYVDELIQQIDTLFYALHIRSDLVGELARVDELGAEERYRLQNTLFAAMNTAYYSFSRKIDNLTLYIHATGRAYSVNYANSGMNHSLEIEDGPWSRIQKQPIGLYFKSSGGTLSAYHSMNEFQGQELIGGIAVRIDDKVWGQAASLLQSEPESSIFLISDEGELLPGSSPLPKDEGLIAVLEEMKPESPDVRFIRTDNYYAFAKQVGGGQLHIVKAIPAATIDAIARKTMMAGIWTGVLFAVISIILSIVVSFRISRPIVSLAKTMRKAHIHDFEMKAVQSKDEIGLLEVGYNFMMARMKALIENEYQREIDLKNAQLIALQAQINPHFLNNTLHMIGGMALVKGAPEIYRVTHVMGDLLRYSISSEQEQTVQLSDEMKHTSNYLYIQEQRFAGRCTVKLFVEERAGAVTMPKFTLQPIVENAFEHGLQAKEGEWRLEIRARVIGKRLVLIVKDGGVGMERERLAQLRRELASTGQLTISSTPSDELGRRRGIGLSNVHGRLAIAYGKRYGIRLFGEKGAGTLVVLALPAAEAMVDDGKNKGDIYV
jgi:two-component system sensor histidine kinase YesM